MTNRIFNVGREPKIPVDRSLFDRNKNGKVEGTANFIDQNRGSTPPPLQIPGILQNLRQIEKRHGLLVASVYYPRADLSLPEPRFVQTGVDVKVLGKKRYEIPIVEDRWDKLRLEKTAELISLKQEECAPLSINVEHLECIEEKHECLEKATRCSGFREDRSCETVCVASISKPYTAFSVRYADMDNIRREGAFLKGDDNVFFVASNGQEYEIDYASTEEATKAARLLEELRFINRTIANDSRGNPYAEQIAKVRSQYESASRKTQKKEAAKKALSRLTPEERRKVLEEVQRENPTVKVENPWEDF